MSFEHPLGLPKSGGLPRSSPYTIDRGEQCIGAAVAGVDVTLNLPERHGEHNWLVCIKMATPAKHLLAGGFAFRPHAMTDLHAYCWVCERDFDEDIAEGPCLGDPRGLPVPTRAEFRGWPDEKRAAWVETWGSRE